MDLDREEKAAARGFMMTGWSGLDSYTFDRIGRGTIHVEAVNLSLIGTVQPARLIPYMRKSLQNSDDGLIQRLQLAAWPDMSPDWVPGDRAPDAAAKDRGLIPRIALVLHLASDGKGPIPLDIVKQALLWADYLGGHARRIYAAVEADNADTARAIWKHVEAGDLQDGFTVREIYTKGWSGLRDREQVQEGLEALAEANWLRPSHRTDGGTTDCQVPYQPASTPAQC